MLPSYLAATADSPSPSAIAAVWASGGVPQDVDPASGAALREAIEAFERRRPSPEAAAEAAAGDWSGWRANLMPREEFVRGFIDEVARRSATQGEHAAILQAAQAMRNHLDDLYGAAGARDRPEDPQAMWLWDLHLRTPGAAEEIARLKALPDGQGLWNDYTRGRKAAIACAFDDASATALLAATIDQSRYRRPEIVTALAAGRKVPLDFKTMAYLSGLLEHRLARCEWVGPVDGLPSILRFQAATVQLMLTNEKLFDLSGVIVDSVEFATSSNAGRADAEAMDGEFDCVSPLSVAIAHGLVRTVKVDSSVASDSLFVQSCSTQGLDLAQCACLAELGRAVAPRIDKSGYDRATTIKGIAARNPILVMQIGVLCGIGDY